MRAVKGKKAYVLCLVVMIAFLGVFDLSCKPVYAATPTVTVTNALTGSNVTSASLHDNFTVNVSIKNSPSNLGGYQFTLVWNASILNCTGYSNTTPTEWGTNIYVGKDQLNRTNPDGTQSYSTVIVATLGSVNVGPEHVVSTFNFTVIGTGETGLLFPSLVNGNPLLGDIYGTEIPCTGISGLFQTIFRNAAVVGINAWSPRILQNLTAEVNVTVTNTGNTPTDFSVFAYYNSSTGSVNSIGPSQSVTNLAGGSNETIVFNWTTTGVAIGVYTIFANVSGGQIGNKFVGGTVDVQSTIDHDIALASFTANATGLVEPEKSLLVTNVQNQGNVNEENCTLSVYYNQTLTYLAQIPEILVGESLSYPYVWNSVNRSGNNFFAANVSLKTGETDSNLANNYENLTLAVSRSSPVASFTVSSIKPTVYQKVTFDASNSTDPLGTIANYTWDFGDSTYLEYGVVVTHIYTESGNYTVRMMIKDVRGLTYYANRPLTYSCLAQKNITVEAAKPALVSNSMLSYVVIIVIVIELLSLIVIVRRKLIEPAKVSS